MPTLTIPTGAFAESPHHAFEESPHHARNAAGIDWDYTFNNRGVFSCQHFRYNVGYDFYAYARTAFQAVFRRYTFLSTKVISGIETVYTDVTELRESDGASIGAGASGDPTGISSPTLDSSTVIQDDETGILRRDSFSNTSGDTQVDDYIYDFPTTWAAALARLVALYDTNFATYAADTASTANESWYYNADWSMSSTSGLINPTGLTATPGPLGYAALWDMKIAARRIRINSSPAIGLRYKLLITRRTYSGIYDDTPGLYTDSTEIIDPIADNSVITIEPSSFSTLNIFEAFPAGSYPGVPVLDLAYSQPP